MKNQKIIFTVCTNNYLAQASLLANSVKQYAPDYSFYLFLADKFNDQIDYKSFEDINFVGAEQLPIDFDDLISKYNIVELNTSIKASCFKYIFDKFDADIVHYFDPDIMLFSSIDSIDQYFSDANILLTPHTLSQIKWQDGSPNENLFLRHGLYNLGYLGLKKSNAASEALNWWENRTITMGFDNPKQGFFVDQLWMNYIPLFYPADTHIILDKGCNMGPWNLHERNLSYPSDKILINNETPLKFYHFSSYNYLNHEISKNYRYTFSSNPDVQPLYNDYQRKMIEAGVDKYSKFTWAYQKKKSLFKKLFKK